MGGQANRKPQAGEGRRSGMASMAVGGRAAAVSEMQIECSEAPSLHESTAAEGVLLEADLLE